MFFCIPNGSKQLQFYHRGPMELKVLAAIPITITLLVLKTSNFSDLSVFVQIL